jgi:two-component system cell cycle sensor histidine kinase/response regulator CckA
MTSPPPAAYAGFVLLVDDYDPLRRVIARLLRGIGYLVYEERTGEAAIEFVATHHGPIDVLVMDVVLEDMSGVDVAAAIRLVRPGLPVLHISGSSKNSLSGVVVDATHHFLAKPFRSEQLFASVWSLIAGYRARHLTAVAS